MEIKIDVLVEHSLDPNDYFYLYYLVNNKVLPFNMTVDQKRLELLGFIKILDNKIQVRQKAIDIFAFKPEDLPVQINPEPPEVDAVEHLQAEMGQQVAAADVEGWIEQWRNLFPRGVKTGGYPVRGTKQGCIKKMKKFVKNNPKVTIADIFDATKRYVEERRMYRFQYMKIADYFIEKEGSSLLDSYVEEDFIRKQNGSAPLLEEDQLTNRMTDDV